MVRTSGVVFQFFFFILCTINGLHSIPRNHPSLGILNELMGQDSKSPLVVVVDSNNQARALNDDEPNQDQGYSQGHYKSRPNQGAHDHYPAHEHSENHVHSNSDKLSSQQYENALYELLKASQKILQLQQERSRPHYRQGKKKDSCENDKQEFLAEQCSKSENSCDNDKC